MHDSFIRSILSDKSVAADYFQNYLPVAISEVLDFETLTQSPDTYLSDELQKSMSDIVYHCTTKDGSNAVTVSLLVEHKSRPDKHTPVQIGSYIFSALQKQIANNKPLTLVIPVLLYHGQEKWQYRTLVNLFDNLEPGWERFIPDFSYIYNNLSEVPDEQIEALNNRFLAASLLALKHSFEKNWLGQNALRVLILTNNAPNRLQKPFLIYFFERSELREAEIVQLLNTSANYKNTIMSTADYFVEKGEKKGEEKKSIEVVKNLLTANQFTITQIANFANVTEAFVLKVKEMM